MKKFLTALLMIFVSLLHANYSDQHFEYRDMDSMFQNAEEVNNLIYNSASKQLELADDATFGYIIFAYDSSEEPFDEGLPSWNGYAPRYANSGFAVQMRFPYSNTWSPWVTVGYWHKDIWNPYGSTSWSGGRVNIDEVELYNYQSKWQFKVVMMRNDVTLEAPGINKLSFFASDSRTTNSYSVINAINDKPEAIFIDTEFYYQYGLDDEIGGSICSPTSVSMILRSFDIELDPVQFARDNYDEHWGIFGNWPRVVQNASEFGLDGAVTRYRTWSDAREVLARGGRIAISVGQPLYSGHLMMLAGFDDNGNPIIHDPARSNGYAYKFNKADISNSWFQKGGVSYTFYLKDSTTAIDEYGDQKVSDDFKLIQNYPNPFNNTTKICYQIPSMGTYELKIFNLRGKEVLSKNLGELSTGQYNFTWEVENLSSGVYIAKVSGKEFDASTRMIYLK